MFELITAVCAVTAFATEMKAVSMAANPKYCPQRNYNVPLRMTPCFEEAEVVAVPPTKAYALNPRQIEERARASAMKQKRASDKTLDFIFEEADYLLDITKEGGVIPKSKLTDVDTAMIIDFLFKQESVESVDETDEGIVVTIKDRRT